MSLLRVRIRRKAYPGASRPALENLAFAAEAGEILAIVGPSGSGKSTLLHLIAGLDRDLDGQVVLDGEPAGGQARPPRLGVMFQSSRLMPWLTVLDNLRLVLGPGTDAGHRAGRLLEDVELAEVAGAYPGQLSGGMQRRVALARALAVEPRLLLLDEPLVSLDAPTAARLRRYLVAYWQSRRPTVLYVTHDLREALAVADRVVFLSRGPGRVVLELPVDLPRPREPDTLAVVLLYEHVLATHPEVLAGQVAASVTGDVLPAVVPGGPP